MLHANTPKKPRAGCPLCRKPVVAEHAPFCSRGCRDRDLLNWIDEGYRIPGRIIDEDSDDMVLDKYDE